MDVSLGKISVGTSGYSYEEWLNDFYPARTPAQQMLPYYAQTFSLTEWVEKRIMTMADQAKAGYILFNNHVRGQAPRNGLSMERILKQAGLM